MISDIKYFTDKIDSRYPFMFFDVGAMGGIPRKWDLLRGVLRAVAFEPDPREFSKLHSGGRTTYLNYAVHKQSQDLPFYIAREGGKSSVYKPNKSFLSQFVDVERFDTVEEKTFLGRQVKNLDSIVTEHSIADVDFIKLDTQGSELPILEGGQRAVLPKVFGIHVEVEFSPMYEDQPLFRDVDRFLGEQGFQLMDIRRGYWKRKNYYDFFGKGQLIFGDALYFRRTESLVSEFVRSQDAGYCRSKLYKCILSCLVYRAFDYAATLLSAGFEKKYFSENDYMQALAVIKKYSKKGELPDFWGRGKIYSALNRICEKLKPRSYLGWADGDRRIGNTKDI